MLEKGVGVWLKESKKGEAIINCLALFYLCKYIFLGSKHTEKGCAQKNNK